MQIPHPTGLGALGHLIFGNVLPNTLLHIQKDHTHTHRHTSLDFSWLPLGFACYKTQWHASETTIGLSETRHIFLGPVVFHMLGGSGVLVSLCAKIVNPFIHFHTEQYL